MLRKRGIKHNVLNAKFHEQEAAIVAEAGVHGAVTIATNMAGRGTDIKLDDEAKAAGGLHIVGTERHESRRIDNQLRGRAGRQGDPGQSQFFISLEDDLMRLFGSERLMGMFEALGVPDGEQIHHKMLSNAIAKAQEKIELNNYGIRENLLKYDEVNNDQRDVIYTEREKGIWKGTICVLSSYALSRIQWIIMLPSVSERDRLPRNGICPGLNDTLMSIIPLKKLRLIGRGI